MKKSFNEKVLREEKEKFFKEKAFSLFENQGFSYFEDLDQRKWAVRGKERNFREIEKMKKILTEKNLEENGNELGTGFEIFQILGNHSGFFFVFPGFKIFHEEEFFFIKVFLKNKIKKI